uniref:uncharacterized protein LOC120336866 n=1 Tax=Styela clava TaxID=7725 RepID=UPI0019399903|nr:uncharacterized protein LOC120336866 [Styela clava]
MRFHYITVTWKEISKFCRSLSSKIFHLNCGNTRLWIILLQFMFIHYIITLTLGLASGMAILDKVYLNDIGLVKQTYRPVANDSMQKVSPWTQNGNNLYINRNKWKNNLMKRLKTARSRLRRNIANNPSPTVNVINTWPHTCRVITPRIPKLPVIYECVPQILNPVVVDLSHSTPTVLVVEPTSQVVSGGSMTPNTTTLSPTNMYALRDVITQFDVPDDVTELRMWFQGIVSIEGSSFHRLNKLKVLNLQHNQISYLSIDAFRGLSELRELDLSYNRVQAIPSLTFKYLSNLEVLHLHHNEISYVQNSMFCGLKSILTLDLSYNEIDDVGPHALRHFRSAYTLSIELGHNKLRIPKKEWLLRAPTKLENDPLCEKAKEKDGKIRTFTKHSKRDEKTVPNSPGFSIDNKVKPEGELAADSEASEEGPIVEQSPVRILRATHNPWSCKCDSQFCLVQFLRLYRSIMTSEFDENDNKVFEIFRYNEINETSGDLKPVKRDTSENITNVAVPQYVKWYFTLPCDSNDEFSGYDLGRLTPKQQINIEKTCCQLIKSSESVKKIMNQDETFGEICKDENDDTDGQLTENHVTVIGIVIVFCTPILLTLCPDCNRTVVPTSGGGMVAGGKFGGGALSTNNNNNNKPRSGLWKEDRKPFNNDRFCLVVQQVETKSRRSFYVEEVV